MKMTLFAKDVVGCIGGSCPQIYKTDRQTFVVQGYQLPSSAELELGIPSGEAAVEIPEQLVAILISKLKQ